MQSLLKKYREGTDRLVAPDQTLQRVRPLMSAMGITRISNVTGLDVIDVPVAMACRPNSRSISVTQGKGLTLSAAKASALMEAVEGYHADHITLPLVLGSLNELQHTFTLVDCDRLLTVDGQPFQPDRPLLWIEGTELISEHRLWVPFDLVHCDFTYVSRLGRGMFRVTTNGLASGNHLVEATSHAICEVVERDATALWRMLSPDRRRATRIDLTTVNDPSCRDILGRLARAGVTVAVWETTSDVGLACFYAAVVGSNEVLWGPAYAAEGTGCHPRREIALLRALTESVQARLTMIVGSRDDVYRSDYQRVRTPRTLEAVKLIMQEDDRHRDFQTVPTFDHATFEEDVALELDRLKSAGVTQVVAINLTKAELGIPVVRVIVPGFEFFVSEADHHPGLRARAVAMAQA